MTVFAIKISPPIPSNVGRSLPKSGTLEYEDFEGNNQDRISEYWFGDTRLSYGESSLYQIYIDISNEMDKLEAGGEHYFELSYYPVARIVDIGGGMVTLSNFQNEENLSSLEKVWSRENVVKTLFRKKCQIEQFINEVG